MAPEEKPRPEGTKDEKPTKEKHILRVDQLWSRKDRQFHFVKTAKPKTGDRFRKYTLVVRRVISSKGLLAKVEVDIKSTKLAELLLEILKGAEGLELTKSPPKIDPKVLFHAWKPLETRLSEERIKEKPDTELIHDICTALEYLQEEFAGIVADLRSLLEHEEITYDLLWAIFPPNAVVFTENNLLREPQAAKFSWGVYEESDEGRWYAAVCNILHSDGDLFGWATPQFKIPAFDGTRKIATLAAYPLKFHAEPDNLRQLLLHRGRKYMELVRSPICQEYQGFAVYQDETMGKLTEKRFTATGRVMVDPPAFQSQNPNAENLLAPYVFTGRSTDASSYSDDDLVLCNHRILGFSFVQKKWAALAVSKMTEVVWNEAAFDKLILEEKKRKMIKLLVKSHKTDDAAFDDFVSGKGKGLVGLLSGSPGVGKTLTAEVVAELSKRPLYIVSAGELGTTVDKVDSRIGMILDITKRWGCVLLIDEADVFLYKRGEAQLERNAVVSVFLRRLEYFQGIIILTTNRRRDIDEAFKSRIHFKFHYPPLNEEGRLMIWKNLLDSVADQMGNLKLSGAELANLAKQPMNGREIKNAVSCAVSIVRASKEQLTVDLVKEILGSLVDEYDSSDDECCN